MAKSKSVSELRSFLKSKGVKGKLSKMNRKTLQGHYDQLLAEQASNQVIGGPAPAIAPKSDEQVQAPDDASNSLTSGAAPATAPQGISLAPAKSAMTTPLQIQGSGTKHKTVGFRKFFKENAKKYGGNMSKAAAAWRELKDGSALAGSGETPHDKFMDATHDYCEQKGDGLAETQMNGAGRNDDDTEGGAYEEAQMQQGMGQAEDLLRKTTEQKGGTKRKREDDAEIRQAEAHVAFDQAAVQANAADAAAAAEDLDDAQETLATLRRDATMDSFAEDPYRMRMAADEPDEPYEDLRDAPNEAAVEDFHFQSIQDSAANVDLYSQQYEDARDDLLAAHRRLARAQSRLRDLRRARTQAANADDAEDRAPDAAHQQNAEERSVASVIDEFTSDDEDELLRPIQTHFESNLAGQDPYHISDYFEGGSFWKDAADVAGAALTSAAPALMAAPIPGARVAGLAALGLGAAASGASAAIEK